MSGHTKENAVPPHTTSAARAELRQGQTEIEGKKGTRTCCLLDFGWPDGRLGAGYGADALRDVAGDVDELLGDMADGREEGWTTARG